MNENGIPVFALGPKPEGKAQRKYHAIIAGKSHVLKEKDLLKAFDLLLPVIDEEPKPEPKTPLGEAYAAGFGNGK
jgi:hypothetical protein